MLLLVIKWTFASVTTSDKSQLLMNSALVEKSIFKIDYLWIKLTVVHKHFLYKEKNWSLL